MTADASKASEFYNDVWESYGHLDAQSPAAFHRRRLIVAQALDAKPDARRALDVGCGQGVLLNQLAAALPRAAVSGADVSERSLEDTRRRCGDRELFLLDLSTPDFEQQYSAKLGHYDLVVCSEVIEHLPDERAVGSLFSLLEPGGVAIVTVPGGKMSRFDELIGHQRHYRPGRLRELLASHGFAVDHVLAWGFPFHSLYRTAVRIASRATMPGAGEPEAPKKDGMSGVLGRAYSLFGRGLKPLFYLNASRWGEQLIAVARRPADG